MQIRRILVAVKRVVDAAVRVRVRNDGSGVSLEGVKMGINPFDEIALEEALRLKDSGGADEVVVISIGNNDCQQQLRTALAMGADRAMLVECSTLLAPLAVARVLLEIARRELPLLVLLGKQSIDGDNNQTGQMLAALWDRPQATFACKIAINDNRAIVVREVDAGLETIEIDLPAVITADLRLNEPRYVTLPAIMKAKKKPLEVIPLASLGVVTTPRMKVLGTTAPQLRSKGVMLSGAQELATELRAKGLI